MDKPSQALLQQLDKTGFPKIAGLWRPLLADGCTIYLRSEEGHRPLDGYALHWVSRLLPATAENVDIVPVYDEIRSVSPKNLIVFGRLHAFKGDELFAQMGGNVVNERAHFRAIDGERLIRVDTGQMWVRVEQQKWVRDFGVLRLWQQPGNGRIVVNFSGLGPIGTLGTALAITDLSRPAMAEVESRLPGPGKKRRGFVEILVKAEREPESDPIVVNPAEVSVRVENLLHGSADLNWPLMVFARRPADDGDRFEVRVINTKNDDDRLLTRSQVEFAVLAAIAERTESEPSLYARQGGYIAYEQIARSEIVQQILHDSTGLHVPVVRATIARLRRKLQTPEWDRAFPNLILSSKIRPEGARKEVVVLRLRAKFQFDL